jgi:beta-glucuronidase
VSASPLTAYGALRLIPTATVVRAAGRHGLPPHAREVPVPASYTDIFTDPEVHGHVGQVWYETVVRVPSGWAGERIVLRFGSATPRATVWVDGQQVIEHEGGFTPFEAEVTNLVEAGAEHRVTALVDNVLRWDSTPPGYVVETPDGPHQRLLFDFYNYAGLHRTVWLYSTPRAYVPNVSVLTGLDGATGTVTYNIDAVDAQGMTVKARLKDAEATDVAVAEGPVGELTIVDVRPWRPGESYLYQLTVEIADDDSRPELLHAPGRRSHPGGARTALSLQRRAVLLPGLWPA